MPRTWNGVGTWYWGKANRAVHRRLCPQCGHHADLESYDTTKYAVLFYVPVLPLGRLRVLDACPLCEQHLTMKLADWRRQKKEEVAQARSTFESSPSSRETAYGAIDACIFFEDPQAFLDLSKAVLSWHAGDAETVARLGSGFEHFGYLDQAEQAYSRAVELQDEPDNRAALVRLLVQRRRFAEARDVLEPLYDKGGVGTGPFYLLVQGLQAEGRHDEAAAELERIAGTFLGMEDEPTHQRFVGVSASLGEGEQVTSIEVAPPVDRSEVAGADWTGWIARTVWPLPAALGLAALVFAGTQHKVHFVNGLDRPYRVEVAGKSIDLPPGEVVARRLALRREYTVDPGDDAPKALEPAPLRMELSFWQGVVGSAVYVVNPDRTAVLVEEEMIYAENPEALDPEQEMPFTVLTGETVYRFDGVSYLFEPFPDEISLGSGEDQAWRKRVDTLGLPTVIAYSVVAGSLGEEAAADYLVRNLELGEEGASQNPMLASVLDPERFRAGAGDRLARRPVDVPWHRAYGEAMALHGLGDELRSELQVLVEVEPDDPDLRYLLARAQDDPAATVALLEAAATRSEVSPWTHHGLGFDALVRADFERALEHGRAAVTGEPDEPTFSYVVEEARRGLGLWEELLADNLQSREEGLDGFRVAEEVLLRSAMGQTEEAQAAVVEFLSALEDDGGPLETWTPFLEGYLAWGQGDFEAYARHMALDADDPTSVFKAAVVSGDLVGAGLALGTSEYAGPYGSLLVYLVSLEAGVDGEVHLDDAVSELEQLDAEGRRLAAVLRAAGPSGSDDDLLALPLDPGHKAIAFTVLAKRWGPAGRPYADLARRLAYGPDFPSRWLVRVLDRS
ncbi:MAG: hypothetical protein AAGN66_05990 [Acidobacteriota bacterium]